MSDLQVVAHRGAAADFPENTLPAIEAAFHLGATHVEIDLQFTADQVPVLFHDCDLHRATGKPGAITELEYDEVRGLHPHYPDTFGQRYLDVTIPSLAEFVRLLSKWPDRFAFVELKPESIAAFGIEATVERTLAALTEVARRCCLISYDRDALRYAGARGIAIGWILDQYTDSALKQATALTPAYLFCNHKKIPEDVTALWQGPWQWVMYEITDIPLAHRLMAIGCDMIETMAVARLLGK